MRGATTAGERVYQLSQFQSTLLMRGATTAGESVYQLSQFQSTLLMRGATRQIFVSPVFGQIISIHAPHARSDEILKGLMP